MDKNKTPSIFIFDANFFIALKEVKASRPYFNLSQAKQKLNVEFYVSGAIFNECPFIVGRDFQEFSKGVKIELTTDKDLDQVKKDLKARGQRLLAQDPDLTLVALAKQLKNNSSEVYIVSDDYKLAQNVESLKYDIKFYSLPAFIQYIGQNLTGNLKTYYKLLRKKVLKLNLDFMMSRSNIYAPQAKIAWLIEQAVDVAGQEICFKQNIGEDEKLKQEQDDFVQISKICEDYLEERPLSKPKLDKIKKLTPALDKLRKSRKYMQDAKKSLENHNLKEALNLLNLAKSRANKTLQLIGLQLSEKDYQIMEKFLASVISKITFFRAFIFLSANKVQLSLNALEETSLFSTVARIPETVLTINYLIALIYLYNSLYNKAIKQFNFINKLAEGYGKQTLKLKAIIGSSITNFLIGEQAKAVELVSFTVDALKKEEIEELMLALIDTGDYFLALGFPEIASNLYSEALECAIDTKTKWKYNFILNKMKKSYLSTSLIGMELRPSSDISVLINKYHDLQDCDTFNDIMEQLADFTNNLYEPFEYFTPKGKKETKFHELPECMHDEWDCVKIQENPETGRTLLISFKEEIGLVAFDVLLDSSLEGVAENYKIKIKSTAKLQIIAPDIIKETLFLIRAMIFVPDEDRDIEIIREMPVFFKQMRM